MKANNSLRLFFYWINERTKIMLRKERGQPWPWTQDPILQEYKFTNAFREHDRGTVWLNDNWRQPYAHDPELFVNIAMYRRYNWIGTAEALGYLHDYDAHAITQQMLERRNRGEQVFTGAHMLCGNIRTLDGYMPPTKVEQIFGIAFPMLWAMRHDLEPASNDNLESTYNRFLKAKIPGYGPFIIYEVVSDLRWTRYLDFADDIMTWANPGPGAKRGIQRIELDGPIGTIGFNNSDYIAYMRWLLGISSKFLGKLVPKLEMREIEHSLCEYDKYCRVMRGEGRPRSKYDHRA